MPRRVPLLAAVLALALPATATRGDSLGEARRLLGADRPAAAATLLEARVREEPGDRAAFAALGEARRRRCDLPLARAAYARALELDPADPEARAGLAETFLLEGRPEEALAAAQRGIDLQAGSPAPDGGVWRVKALALVELRRYDLAVEAAERGVALSPERAKCAEALAAARFRAGRMDLAGEAYRRATELDPRAEEANLRLGNGFGPAYHGKPWRDGAEAPAFQAALAAWEAGDLADAEARFLALVRLRPDAYKYRLGVGLCRLSERRRQEVLLGGDPTALYALLPAPEIEGLEALVPGYGRLGATERHVVRVATAPARPLLGALRAAGANHEVIPLAEDLTESERRRDLTPRRTFDGRWYEHLRGVAGAQGATGAEKLREAAEFAFNTFAHEFGHQVHRHGLSTAQQARVDVLYDRARGSGACLDYYAATNADEYFAQGYEAYVSPLKRGCLTETARHTREELARRDPDLLAFLSEILDASHERPEVVVALRFAARTGLPPALAEPAGR